MKRTACALLACAALDAGAIQVGTPVTYSGLLWNASINAPGLTLCTRLVVDATADLTRSSTLMLGGALNCPALNAGYGVFGSGYIATDGTLNLTISVAGQWTLSCPRLINFSGSCTVFDPTGATRGFAQVLFVL